MIQQFHRHWLQICGNGRLPKRADIDPVNFKRILPNVILTDLEDRLANGFAPELPVPFYYHRSGRSICEQL